VSFSRLVGVEHASFKASRYAANMEPSVRHRTQLIFYSTSISASSAAVGVSRRIFLLPLQANLICIGNTAEEGFSYSAARHDHAPSALQRKPSTPRTRYVRHRTDGPHTVRYAGFEVQAQHAGRTYGRGLPRLVGVNPVTSRPCINYFWSQA